MPGAARRLCWFQQVHFFQAVKIVSATPWAHWQGAVIKEPPSPRAQENANALGTGKSPSSKSPPWLWWRPAQSALPLAAPDIFPRRSAPDGFSRGFSYSKGMCDPDSAHHVYKIHNIKFYASDAGHHPRRRNSYQRTGLRRASRANATGPKDNGVFDRRIS